MKTFHQITALAVLLSASAFVAAQTTDPAPAPREDVTDMGSGSGMDGLDNDDDSGKWGLAGLLGLLGLLGMRRHHDHNPNRGTNVR